MEPPLLARIKIQIWIRTNANVNVSRDLESWIFLKKKTIVGPQEVQDPQFLGVR